MMVEPNLGQFLLWLQKFSEFQVYLSLLGPGSICHMPQILVVEWSQKIQKEQEFQLWKAQGGLVVERGQKNAGGTGIPALESSEGPGGEEESEKHRKSRNSSSGKLRGAWSWNGVRKMQEEQEFQLWKAGAPHCLAVPAAPSSDLGNEINPALGCLLGARGSVRNQPGGLLFACKHQKNRCKTDQSHHSTKIPI